MPGRRRAALVVQSLPRRQRARRGIPSPFRSQRGGWINGSVPRVRHDALVVGQDTSTPCPARRMDQSKRVQNASVQPREVYKRATPPSTSLRRTPSLGHHEQFGHFLDYSLQGYRMVSYHKSSSSITPMKFSAQALDDYMDLNRSFFVIDLRLYSSATNGIVVDANSASDANNIKFVYAVNNVVHTIFMQINLRFNGALMSEKTDSYAYSAYLETLLNYNRDDGETLLAPQGWVNFLNVTPTLAAAGVNDDISTTANWAHNNDNLLKTLTTPFRGKNVVRLIMRPYFPAFHMGKIMVPGVEMNLELYFNSPDFYTFSILTSGTRAKRYVQLREQM